jgi:cystathionine gamma-lyase
VVTPAVVTMIHVSAVRARWGDPVADGFVRIAAGIEDTDDLLADIEHALGTTQ